MAFEWLRRGTFRKHLQRLREKLREVTSDTLRDLRAAGWEVFFEPRGGPLLWIRLPNVEDSSVLAARGAKFGVTIAPGSYYHVDNRASPWIRINVAYAAEERARAFLQSVGNPRSDTPARTEAHPERRASCDHCVPLPP